MTALRELLLHYLPSTTHIMLLADIRECPMGYVEYHQRFNKEMNPLRGRNEVFHAMNQVVFDTFQDLLQEENSQYMTFLDAGSILCPFTCSWHDDGGHMKGWVYRELLKYYFQYICG